MTNRQCQKCGDTLLANQKLMLMECVSGKHIEPVNLQRGQFWNKCPKCGQMGVNDRDGETKHQSVLKISDGKGGKVRVPETVKVNDKEFQLVFKKNLNQVPVTCRACGNTWTKKEATG